MTPVARIMERRQIRALILSDPIELTLMRAEKVKQPSGGYKFGSLAPVLPNGEPQIATLIPFKRRMTEFLVNTELGEVPDLPYVLLGFHTLDIKKDDVFDWEGDRFEVKTVDLKQEVRIAAHVDYYGGNKNG